MNITDYIQSSASTAQRMRIEADIPPLAAALARANVPELMTFHVRELRALEAA